MTDYLKLIKLQEAKEMAKYDNVKEPEHYKQYTIEPLTVRKDWQLPDLLGDVIKYLGRYRYKGKPLEDLKKAQRYLNEYVAWYEAQTMAQHTTYPVIEEDPASD